MEKLFETLRLMRKLKLQWPLYMCSQKYSSFHWSKMSRTDIFDRRNAEYFLTNETGSHSTFWKYPTIYIIISSYLLDVMVIGRMLLFARLPTNKDRVCWWHWTHWLAETPTRHSLCCWSHGWWFHPQLTIDHLPFHQIIFFVNYTRSISSHSLLRW